MKLARSFFIPLLVTSLLADCKKPNTTDPQATSCQPPVTLMAKAPCESGYPGAMLTASDYQSGPETQFIYYIFLQKDTLSNDITKSSYANASNDHILISETVLKDAPKFVVLVTINCSGKDNPSQYFSFVKRATTNPACYVWARQNQ